jgi:hypothetical protein
MQLLRDIETSAAESARRLLTLSKLRFVEINFYIDIGAAYERRFDFMGLYRQRP